MHTAYFLHAVEAAAAGICIVPACLDTVIAEHRSAVHDTGTSGAAC